MEIVRFLARWKVHNVAKRFVVTFAPLSVRMYVGMLSGTLQWSNKGFAICVDVFLGVGIARYNLKQRFVMTRMRWFFLLFYKTIQVYLLQLIREVWLLKRVKVFAYGNMSNYSVRNCGIH